MTKKYWISEIIRKRGRKIKPSFIQFNLYEGEILRYYKKIEIISLDKDIEQNVEELFKNYGISRSMKYFSMKALENCLETQIKEVDVLFSSSSSPLVFQCDFGKVKVCFAVLNSEERGMFIKNKEKRIKEELLNEIDLIYYSENIEEILNEKRILYS